MIEMVYSGKESEEQGEVKLPKNIRQIGDNKSKKKVYIEDYVVTQLKKKPKNDESVKYGVLLGEVKKSKGCSYIFVKGMVEVKDVIENSLIFNDEIWATIYKDVKQFFDNVEIVGWFVSLPYRVKDDMSGIRKIHLDNFAGNDKVCFVGDRTEKEDGFYIFENGNLQKQAGYYIYYEKNERMKRYLKMTNNTKNGASGGQAKSENERKQSEEKKQAEMKKQNIETGKKDVVNKNQSFREIIRGNNENMSKNQDDMQRKQGKIAYAVSGVLIVALLLSTIVMLNNYGELKNIKVSLESMNADENAQAVNKIIDSLTETTSGNSKKNEKGTTGNKGTAENSTSDKATNSQDTTNNNAQEKTTKKSDTQNNEMDTEDRDKDDNEPAANIYSGSYHTVLSGQTLYDISMKYYGTSSMVDSIKRLNEINDDYTIIEGQKILLP